MRTFEIQRKEFIELALKLIEKDKMCSIYFNSEKDMYIIYIWAKVEFPDDFIRLVYFQIFTNNELNNEAEIQELRDLVEGLG